MIEQMSQNRLIREMLKDKGITSDNLKKIYRALCKKTHPDITGKNGNEFINLQREYEEARKYVVEFEGLSAEKILKPRYFLYKNLRDYVSYGLFSSRIRKHPVLKQRNEALLTEIIKLANLYSKEFMKIFLEYNRVHIKKLNEWSTEKKIKNAKRLFLSGINCFLDYEGNGNILSYRASKSYLYDCICELKLIGKGHTQNMLNDFCVWILKELELPPVKFFIK